MTVDIETLAHAQNDGYDAYCYNRPVQPTLSPVIRKMIKNMEVGDGASEIFRAFTRGYNMAADEACARILAEG